MIGKLLLSRLSLLCVPPFAFLGNVPFHLSESSPHVVNRGRLSAGVILRLYRKFLTRLSRGRSGLGLPVRFAPKGVNAGLMARCLFFT